jgi:hypothetical protein
MLQRRNSNIIPFADAAKMGLIFYQQCVWEASSADIGGAKQTPGPADAGRNIPT